MLAIMQLGGGGGVLSQVGNDQFLHPVAYFSTALQSLQKNWSATSKEAFTLVCAVRHWHVYLSGQRWIQAFAIPTLAKVRFSNCTLAVKDLCV